MRTRRPNQQVALFVATLAVLLVAAGGTLAAVATPRITARADHASVALALDPSQPQSPFLCTTEYNDLGQPKVDNQDRRGTPVYPETTPGTADRSQDPVGWSERCQADARVEYRYRATDGSTKVLAPGAATLPADISYLNATDLLGTDRMDLAGAATVPYLFRYERGTLPDNRFLASVAMLVPFSEYLAAPGPDGPWDDSHWNGRLVFSFGGGVGIGHSQGDLSSGDSQLHEALRLGDAVVYSSGTRTSTHYDLLLGGRTAEELKAHFVAEHGQPLYTVGIGGSGGGIQQYVYAQNHPDLLDALIPQYSYPDMTTQTINIGDCELMEHYMDVLDAGNPRWKNWNNRKLIEGQNSIEGFTSAWQARTGATGSSECIEGWRGSTPLALNPTFGLAVDEDTIVIPYVGEILAKIAAGQPGVPDDFPDLGRILRTSPNPADRVPWTHWADAAEAYGVDPATGQAREPWDNVGVQYGLRAVAQGQITPQEFLDLNAKIGSWKPTSDDVPESCGMVKAMAGDALGGFAKAIGMCTGDDLDQYSARQMFFSTDANQPAPRRHADVQAITNAFESGLEFDGRLGRDVPIIDARHDLEDQLNMHNVHQSFVSRERIRRTMGNAENQVIWFLDARPAIDEAATDTLYDRGFRVMDQWVLNMQAAPGASAAASKPADAVDRCWNTDGSEIAAGNGVWSGADELVVSGQGDWTGTAPTTVDGVAVGACSAHFPMHSTSRVVAGGPITNDVYKCHLKTVQQSIADGDYGAWTPTTDEVSLLERINPEGVCDYSQRSVGYPGLVEPPTTTTSTTSTSTSITSTSATSTTAPPGSSTAPPTSSIPAGVAPAATEDQRADQRNDDARSTLARTGSDTDTLVTLAAALIGAGAVVLLLSRRRRSASSRC